MKTLICTEGSTQTMNAIRFGGLIISACHGEITLLGVYESPELEGVTHAALQRGREVLQELNVTAELILRCGDPVEEIIRHTRETRYDLVVIGAARKGTRGPFLLSTKAYKIIKSVDPPILLVMGKPESLNRILICSGGKKYIDRAVDFTGRIARALTPNVTLFHVIHEPPSEVSDLIRLEDDVNLLLHSHMALGSNLRCEKEALENLGVRCEVKVRHGLVISEITKEIRQGNYDLVVAGSSPSGGTLRTYILGNVTREIVNRTECPVLVVRGGEEPAGFGLRLKGWFSEIRQIFSKTKP